MTGTRQLTKHDGSSICPTKGDHYGIVAIDEFGVEHHSKESSIPHTVWAWEHIVWWRYDDATTIEMLTWKIAELQDELAGKED